jgi:hypothetical protein
VLRSANCSPIVDYSPVPGIPLGWQLVTVFSQENKKPTSCRSVSLLTPHCSSDHIRAVVQRRPLNRGSLGLSSGYEPSSSLVAAEAWNPSDLGEVQYRRVSPDIGPSSARSGISLEARPAIAVRQDEVQKLSQNLLSTPNLEGRFGRWGHSQTPGRDRSPHTFLAGLFIAPYGTPSDSRREASRTSFGASSPGQFPNPNRDGVQSFGLSQPSCVAHRWRW